MCSTRCARPLAACQGSPQVQTPAGSLGPRGHWRRQGSTQKLFWLDQHIWRPHRERRATLQKCSEQSGAAREEKAAAVPALDGACGQRAQLRRSPGPYVFLLRPFSFPESGRREAVWTNKMRPGLSETYLSGKKQKSKTGKALTFLKVIKYPMQGQWEGGSGLLNTHYSQSCHNLTEGKKNSHEFLRGMIYNVRFSHHLPDKQLSEFAAFCTPTHANFAKTKYQYILFPKCIRIYRSVHTHRRLQSRLAASMRSCISSFRRRFRRCPVLARRCPAQPRRTLGSPAPRRTLFSQVDALSLGRGWGYLLKLVS